MAVCAVGLEQGGPRLHRLEHLAVDRPAARREGPGAEGGAAAEAGWAVATTDALDASVTTDS